MTIQGLAVIKRIWVTFLGWVKAVIENGLKIFAACFLRNGEWGIGDRREGLDSDKMVFQRAFHAVPLLCLLAQLLISGKKKSFIPICLLDSI